MNDDRLGPLVALVGTWSGTGEGVYPTIESFGYTEQITFADPQVKPFLAYTQRTRHAVDDRPLHAESGYLRWVQGAPEWTIASPTGVVEVHTGTVDIEGDALTLRCSTLAVMGSPTAKEVASVARVVVVRGDRLHYELSMGAVGQPHQLHLRADLLRTGA
jgi:hypothetical protein